MNCFCSWKWLTLHLGLLPEDECPPIRSLYLFPFMNRCTDSSEEATTLSTLSTKSSHGKIYIDENNRDEIRLPPHHDRYESNKMTFGLNSPWKTVQGVMYIKLSFVHWQVVLVCFDDIEVLSKNVPGPHELVLASIWPTLWHLRHVQAKEMKIIC